jgi:hypothetical protein
MIATPKRGRQHAITPLESGTAASVPYVGVAGAVDGGAVPKFTTHDGTRVKGFIAAYRENVRQVERYGSVEAARAARKKRASLEQQDPRRELVQDARNALVLGAMLIAFGLGVSAFTEAAAGVRFIFANAPIFLGAGAWLFAIVQFMKARKLPPAVTDE